MSTELKTVAFVDGGEHSRRLMWSMLVLPYSIKSGSSLVLRSEAEAEIARLTAENAALRGRWMPLLRTPFAVRMDVLNEVQAQRNHGQSLARLAERGGLGMCEASAIAERRQWREQKTADAAQAIAALNPGEKDGR